MRPILTLVAAVFSLVTSTLAAAAPPAHLWSRAAGGTDNDNGNAVRMDTDGNVYVAGVFRGTANFGGADLVSAGSVDIFLVKYAPDGTHLWSKAFGGTSSDYCFALEVDAAGNLYITGQFSGTLNLGGANLVSAGANDMFVASYNTVGTHRWSRRFGSTTDDVGYGIAVDEGSGHVVVVGGFTGSVSFGGGTLVSAGLYDVVVAKYAAATGLWVASARFGGTGFDAPQGVALDATGAIYVTGLFSGTADFGGGNLVSAGDFDIVLAKYNASIVHQWSQRFGSTGPDAGNSVAIDSFGNVVSTGYFSGSVGFGGSVLNSAGLQDIYLAKHRSNGAHTLSVRFGGTGDDAGTTVRGDGAGNLFLGGYFWDSVNFGGGALVSAGNFDIVIAKYSATGVHQWSRRFGSTISDRANSLFVDAGGHVAVTGAYSEAASFGGATFISSGLEDCFVARYGAREAEPDIASITDVGNDQGRRVRIQFAPSGHDVAGSATPVLEYQVYRRNDALPAVNAGAPATSLSRRELLDLGWVDAGTTAAFQSNGYLVDAPTDADSTIALGQHRSVFFIRAATASPGVFFDSPIDSGYSLDNLAPGAPQNLVYTAGDLSWDESAAADFDFFTVYGSNADAFGGATVVDYTVAPAMDVTGAPYVFYWVTATDFSGNEGRPARVNTLSGVGGTPAVRVLSVSAYPNPFNPETTVRYTLPARGRVVLAVYDLAGARVATLVEGEHDAGAFTARWNGRTDGGETAASGVYFARLETGAGTKAYKLTLLK